MMYVQTRFSERYATILVQADSALANIMTVLHCTKQKSTVFPYGCYPLSCLCTVLCFIRIDWDLTSYSSSGRKLTKKLTRPEASITTACLLLQH